MGADDKIGNTVATATICGAAAALQNLDGRHFGKPSQDTHAREVSVTSKMTESKIVLAKNTGDAHNKALKEQDYMPLIIKHAMSLKPHMSLAAYATNNTEFAQFSSSDGLAVQVKQVAGNVVLLQGESVMKRAWYLLAAVQMQSASGVEVLGCQPCRVVQMFHGKQPTSVDEYGKPLIDSKLVGSVTSVKLADAVAAVDLQYNVLVRVEDCVALDKQRTIDQLSVKKCPQWLETVITGEYVEQSGHEGYASFVLRGSKASSATNQDKHDANCRELLQLFGVDGSALINDKHVHADSTELLPLQLSLPLDPQELKDQLAPVPSLWEVYVALKLARGGWQVVASMEMAAVIANLSGHQRILLLGNSQTVVNLLNAQPADTRRRTLMLGDSSDSSPFLFSNQIKSFHERRMQYISHIQLLMHTCFQSTVGADLPVREYLRFRDLYVSPLNGNVEPLQPYFDFLHLSPLLQQHSNQEFVRVKCWQRVLKLFVDLEDLQFMDLLPSLYDQQDYLLRVHSLIIAMTPEYFLNHFDELQRVKYSAVVICEENVSNLAQVAACWTEHVQVCVVAEP